MPKTDSLGGTTILPGSVLPELYYVQSIQVSVLLDGCVICWLLVNGGWDETDEDHVGGNSELSKTHDISGSGVSLAWWSRWHGPSVRWRLCCDSGSSLRKGMCSVGHKN